MCVCVYGGVGRHHVGVFVTYVCFPLFNEQFIIHTAGKFKMQDFLVIFLLLSFQDNRLLTGNYKKLLQLSFHNCFFFNQKPILLEELYSPKFSITALFLSYGMDIYCITKNHGNFCGML